jgi:hypothetical protein
MNDWRDEFDEEFYHEQGDEVGNYICQSLEKKGDKCDCQLKDIKSFIQDLLDKQADEAAEMQDEAYHKGYGDALKLLDKQREELREWADNHSIGHDGTKRFVFLDDLLTKLEKE